MTKSDIPGLYGKYMFSFIKKLPFFIQNSYIISQSHQKYMSDSISPHPCQYLVLSLLFISAIVIMSSDISLWF